MNKRIISWSVGTLGGLTLMLVSACAVEGGGYGYSDGVDVGYVGGVYEPYGYDYGGWGRGYRVGPPHGGPGPGGWRGGGHVGGHAPGIPSGPHGGGGGGPHGGGGHH
jgi:hypothetical protein